MLNRYTTGPVALLLERAIVYHGVGRASRPLMHFPRFAYLLPGLERVKIHATLLGFWLLGKHHFTKEGRFD